MSHHQKRRFYYAFKITLALSNRNSPHGPTFDNKRKILSTIWSELRQNKNEQKKRSESKQLSLPLSLSGPYSSFIWYHGANPPLDFVYCFSFPQFTVITKSIKTNLGVTWIWCEIGINFVDRKISLACVAIISMCALKMSTIITLPSPSIHETRAKKYNATAYHHFD